METTTAKSSFYIAPRIMEIALNVKKSEFVKRNPENRSILWQTLDHTFRSKGITLPYFQLKELGEILFEKQF